MKRNYTAYFGKDDGATNDETSLKTENDFLRANDSHGVGYELGDKGNIKIDFEEKDYSRIALSLVQDLIRHLYSDTNESKADICSELIGRIQELKEGGVDLDTVKKLSNKYGC